MKEKTMVINRETAMKLWTKAYGNVTKAKDFAGREMDKAAYDQRGSKYGWNIDHILPQSRGGKTTESNLICCHILTNDEKADKFPCFTANGKRFEIIKVENHYEIRGVGNNQGNDSDSEKDDNSVNFFDSAAGVRYYKRLKGVQNKDTFVGIVTVAMKDVKSTAIIDFISEVFCGKGISVKQTGNEIVVLVKAHSLPRKEDTADMLDRCMLLNTYMSYYFVPKNEVGSYSIFYGEHCDKDKSKCLAANNEYKNYSKRLTVNELVKHNNDKAKERLENVGYVGYDSLNKKTYPYNYIYSELMENLKKLDN